MKKKLIAILVATLSLMVFSGCTVNNSLVAQNESNVEQNQDIDENKGTEENKAPVEKVQVSEEIVRNISETADTKIHYILDVRNLDSNYIEINSRTYSLSNEFQTKDSIKNYLKEYLTEEAIADILNKYTLDKENKLYIVYGQRGIAPSFKDDKLTYKEEEDILNANFKKIVDGQLISEYNYEFKLIENKWLLNKYD